MRGRVVLDQGRNGNSLQSWLREKYRLKDTPQLHDRYNIAPSQPVAAVRATDGDCVLVLFKWGLIPSWSKDATIGQNLINARSETVARSVYGRGW